MRHLPDRRSSLSIFPTSLLVCLLLALPASVRDLTAQTVEWRTFPGGTLQAPFHLVFSGASAEIGETRLHVCGTRAYAPGKGSYNAIAYKVGNYTGMLTGPEDSIRVGPESSGPFSRPVSALPFRDRFLVIFPKNDEDPGLYARFVGLDGELLGPVFPYLIGKLRYAPPSVIHGDSLSLVLMDASDGVNETDVRLAFYHDRQGALLAPPDTIELSVRELSLREPYGLGDGTTLVGGSILFDPDERSFIDFDLGNGGNLFDVAAFGPDGRIAYVRRDNLYLRDSWEASPSLTYTIPLPPDGTRSIAPTVQWQGDTLSMFWCEWKVNEGLHVALRSKRILPSSGPTVTLDERDFEVDSGTLASATLTLYDRSHGPGYMRYSLKVFLLEKLGESHDADGKMVPIVRTLSPFYLYEVRDGELSIATSSPRPLDHLPLPEESAYPLEVIVRRCPTPSITVHPGRLDESIFRPPYELDTVEFYNIHQVEIYPNDAEGEIIWGWHDNVDAIDLDDVWDSNDPPTSWHDRVPADDECNSAMRGSEEGAPGTGSRIGILFDSGTTFVDGYNPHERYRSYWTMYRTTPHGIESFPGSFVFPFRLVSGAVDPTFYGRSWSPYLGRELVQIRNRSTASSAFVRLASGGLVEKGPVPSMQLDDEVAGWTWHELLDGRMLAYGKKQLQIIDTSGSLRSFAIDNNPQNMSLRGVRSEDVFFTNNETPSYILSYGFNGSLRNISTLAFTNPWIVADTLDDRLIVLELLDDTLRATYLGADLRVLVDPITGLVWKRVPIIEMSDPLYGTPTGYVIGRDFVFSWMYTDPDEQQLPHRRIGVLRFSLAPTISDVHDRAIQPSMLDLSVREE